MYDPTASFHPFLRLPPELRSRVWAATVEPRTVDARVDCETSVSRLLSSTPVPAMLQACREARNQGLYQRAFSHVTEPRYVWVNFEMDMISIGRSEFDFFKPEGHLIRRLKFEREMNESFFHFRSEGLLHFQNVVEMHVVCLDGLQNWHEAWSDFYWSCRREKLWFIDKETGQMLNSYELDKREDERLAELWREEERQMRASVDWQSSFEPE
ncbi:hypothetical protein CDD83_4588 [Cordyceps sp. RAO-2017]|nr:hypothetical protein CDD83_4588 [Cordyceps sp. RAO-2017]